MHNTKYLVNKNTLKISQLYVNNENEDLLEFLKIDNYVFNDYQSAINRINYLDTMVKFN